MFSAFKTLTGQTVTVELKNDLAIQGTLKSVDQFLNFKLDDIKVLDEARYPHMVRLHTLHSHRWQSSPLLFVDLLYAASTSLLPPLRRSCSKMRRGEVRGATCKWADRQKPNHKLDANVLHKKLDMGIYAIMQRFCQAW